MDGLTFGECYSNSSWHQSYIGGLTDELRLLPSIVKLLLNIYPYISFQWNKSFQAHMIFMVMNNGKTEWFWIDCCLSFALPYKWSLCHSYVFNVIWMVLVLTIDWQYLDILTLFSIKNLVAKIWRSDMCFCLCSSLFIADMERLISLIRCKYSLILDFLYNLRLEQLLDAIFITFFSAVHYDCLCFFAFWFAWIKSRYTLHH